MQSRPIFHAVLQFIQIGDDEVVGTLQTHGRTKTFFPAPGAGW